MKRSRVTVAMIKAALKPVGSFCGANLYPGEPTTIAHCVSVTRGTADASLAALRAAGLTAHHAYAFGPYTEGLTVRRVRGEEGADHADL
jgi:hypothetical protein